MYNNTLYVGMDVHKETFSLCCYDMQQDKVFFAQKMEADYKQVLNYLNAVQKAIGDDVQFVCGYEAGCLGFTLYHQLTRYGVNCVILAPTTMSKPAGKKKSKPISEMQRTLLVVWLIIPTALSIFRANRMSK